MSDQDQILACKPSLPTMAAASVPVDRRTVLLVADSQNSTEDNAGTPADKKHLNVPFDIEAAQPLRGKFRTTGIVLMCCVSLL